MDLIDRVLIEYGCISHPEQCWATVLTPEVASVFNLVEPTWPAQDANKVLVEAMSRFKQFYRVLETLTQINYGRLRPKKQMYCTIIPSDETEVVELLSPEAYLLRTGNFDSVLKSGANCVWVGSSCQGAGTDPTPNHSNLRDLCIGARRSDSGQTSALQALLKEHVIPAYDRAGVDPTQVIDNLLNYL